MDLDIKIGDYDTMFYILKKDAYMKCLREIQKRNLMVDCKMKLNK